MAAKKKKPKKKSAGKSIKKFLKYLFLILFLGAVGFFAYIWFSPSSDRDVWDFVPEDAVFVVEADDPIENWRSLSETKVWKHLKRNDMFADIAGEANYLDTLINDNRQLFKLISGKKLLLVAQMIKADDYDFIYLMDLEQGAKVTFFIDIFKPIVSAAGFPMKKIELGGITAYTINDGEDDIVLGFIENILVASYSKKLVLKVIKQEKKPFYSRNGNFTSVREGAYRVENGESIGKLHLNFSQLDEYMNVFMDEVTGTVIDISEMMGYLSMDLKIDDEFIELGGLVSVDTAKKSLATVLLDQNRSEILAPKILPPNTSFVLTIDYHDFDYFYESVSNLMADNNGYKDFEKTKKQIGNILGVDKKDKKRKRANKRGKDKNYFDWLGQEIALALLPVNESGTKQAYLALIHTPDYENAVHDLAKIAKQIRRRTPVRFKDYEYRGKEINYLAMKGFFKLFLGKLFKKFDKPKYVIMENFVVFSNDTTALHRVIDSKMMNEALYGEANYRRVTKHFSDRSNYFMYINNKQLYPFLPTMTDSETARDIRKNKKFITCFPYAGIQLTSDNGKFETEFYFEFDK